ncbi:MAG: hypothetical protein D6715_13650, partial [Calditrichaeota bacterium]
MASFRPISNPYIVGNPIKTKRMFYGRQDDFEFIRRKLESGVKSYIIVFCGERRSGKTSILFQILNGQLGEDFLPILIDMQTMAGLKNEAEFFEKVALEIERSLPENAFRAAQYNFHSPQASPFKVFDQLLGALQQSFPEKTILFLFDEYELIEAKIQEGTLNPNLITYLGGVLESDRKISFLFTGSNRLEERRLEYWKILLSKSLYRNVSYLSRADTFRLITEPVSDRVSYDEAVLDMIYRLTAGQPFYTQVVCQNLVDYLNEVERTHVTPADLERVLEEILENPLPQMIYYWNSLPNNRKLILSLMAEILDDPEAWTTGGEIQKTSRREEFGLNLNVKTITATLEALFYSRMLRKQDARYNFQMDLFRLWIKRDHSFWQVMKEISASQTEMRMEESIRQSLSEHSRQALEGLEFSPAGGGKRFLRPLALSLVVLALLGAGGYFWVSRQAVEPAGELPVEGLSPVAVQEEVDWRERAQEARSRATDAAQAALQAGVQQRAAELWQRARQQLEQGEAAYQEQHFERAYRAFLQVATLFQAELDKQPEAPRPSVPEKSSQLVSLRRLALEARRSAQQAESQHTAAYRRGVSLLAGAERAEKSGREQEATLGYGKARQAFQQALTETLEAQREAIRRLMAEVQRWRLQAEQAGMQQRDPLAYQAAREMWALAEQDLQQEQFDRARQRLEEAGTLFREGSKPAGATLPAESDIRSLEKNIQQFKQGLPADIHVVEAYRQAEALETEARQDVLAGRSARARDKLQQADRLYRSARDHYQNNLQAIKDLMEQYRQAVEQEDLPGMRRLYVDLSSESQKRWENFFNVVSRLQVMLEVKQIRLFDSAAEVHSQVQFNYQGAEGSGHVQTWVFGFRRVNRS